MKYANWVLVLFTKHLQQLQEIGKDDSAMSAQPSPANSEIFQVSVSDNL